MVMLREAGGGFLVRGDWICRARSVPGSIGGSAKPFVFELNGSWRTTSIHVEQAGQQCHPQFLFIKNRPNYRGHSACLSYSSLQGAGDVCYSKLGRVFGRHFLTWACPRLKKKTTLVFQLEPVLICNHLHFWDHQCAALHVCEFVCVRVCVVCELRALWKSHVRPWMPLWSGLVIIGGLEKFFKFSFWMDIKENKASWSNSAFCLRTFFTKTNVQFSREVLNQFNGYFGVCSLWHTLYDKQAIVCEYLTLILNNKYKQPWPSILFKICAWQKLSRIFKRKRNHYLLLA